MVTQPLQRPACAPALPLHVGPQPVAQRERSVRLSMITGTSPTSTRAKAGNAASPNRSSRASW